MQRDYETTDPSHRTAPRSRGGWWLGALLSLSLLTAGAFVYRSWERVARADAQAREFRRQRDQAAAQLEAERQGLEAKIKELEQRLSKLTQERDEVAGARDTLAQTLQEKSAAVRKLKADNEELKRLSTRKRRR